MAPSQQRSGYVIYWWKNGKRHSTAINPDVLTRDESDAPDAVLHVIEVATHYSAASKPHTPKKVEAVVQRLGSVPCRRDGVAQGVPEDRYRVQVRRGADGRPGR